MYVYNCIYIYIVFFQPDAAHVQTCGPDVATSRLGSDRPGGRIGGKTVAPGCAHGLVKGQGFPLQLVRGHTSFPGVRDIIHSILVQLDRWLVPLPV